MRRHLATLAGVAAVAMLLIGLGPAFLRQGLSALLIISRSAEAASPYKIDVTPGNARVPRGADQTVKAKLQGFTAPDATLMVRLDPAGQFERVPLVPAAGDTAAFEGMLFHVEKTADYFVESNGVRSTTFKMEVVELPTVDHLVLEYRFPTYTGLEPRTVDPGGDVAAIKGTEVRLKITPTMATPGGRVLLNENDSAPLTREADGTLVGNFTVDTQGFYKIELEGPRAEKVNASPQYTIDVLTDQGPSVHFNKPGRDTSASPVEEVFAEVRADDDYGVKKLEMFYSVNGGTEKTINLFGGAKALPEVTATHTLYLEELGLKPGDFVSYYAKAADNDGVQGAKTTTSDIYFVQIRPFRKDFKPAQSMSGGGGGGGGGNQVGQLSQQQREIVAATFNTVRDRSKMSADKFRETTVFLTLAQAKLREQVEELSGKMNSRLDAVDPAFKLIAEALPKAAEEMKGAEGQLKGQKAKEALTPEQRALKLLQDAEQQYEMQVAQQQGGGGGGGQNQMSEDLADLFELELDKLGEPVRDAAAGRATGRRQAGRRAARKAEGTGPSSAAGGRAAAADGGDQPEWRRRQRRQPAAARERGRGSSAQAGTAHPRPAAPEPERRGAAAAGRGELDEAGGRQWVQGRRRPGSGGAGQDPSGPAAARTKSGRAR